MSKKSIFRIKVKDFFLKFLLQKQKKKVLKKLVKIKKKSKRVVKKK